LLKQFGYPIHLAPGEAEAECALLQREGIVDAVLSEDVDTLMFGSGITIRNWSPEKSGKTPTHVNVYDAVETKNGPSGLDREGMILVALMSGGDYVPEGIPGCGPKTACEAAKAGFGHDLCRIPTSDKRAMSEWRQRLQHELKTNESRLFRRKHGTLKIPDNFPRLDILGYYTHPAISNQAGLDKLRRAINWDQDLDFAGLREFTQDAFDWVKLEGAKHFIRSLAPSLLVRQLRIRSKELERLSTSNVQAIQEDESLLVKGIHGKRQHPVTDNCAELRVSFTPIELVTIDLSREEPDDEFDEPPPGSQADEVDPDDEAALELEDDGPKKRGPTKFEPNKPARIWVMESIVKVGVPLTVEDWEAGRQAKLKPRRPATAQDTTSTAPKATKAKRTNAVEDISQAPINSFARVTKPGSKLSRALAKTLKDLSDRETPALSSGDMIDLLSSSPVAQRSMAPMPRIIQRKSPSPTLPDLPPSVSKRKKRGPIQRSQTLPTQLGTASERPRTPPLLNIVESVDLLSSPVRPSPSQLPAKKAKTRTKNSQFVPVSRGASVASSPGKTRQTTLDIWRASATPTRLRDVEPAIDLTPIPAPPALRVSRDEPDELDLTFSSPTRVAPDPSGTHHPTHPSATRPPLTSISSNSSSLSSCSDLAALENGKSSEKAMLVARSRRTSPRLRKTKSASPPVDTVDLLSSQPTFGKQTSPSVDAIDLSCLSSPAPPTVPVCIEPEPARTNPTSPPPTQHASVRRSPRNHVSLSPESSSKTSPPAAWKAREQRKRQIILRKSVAAGWDFADVDSPQKPDDSAGTVLKGKARKKWRESEVEFLDLS
jgi:Holliday junction resolvase YEN1